MAKLIGKAAIIAQLLPRKHFGKTQHISFFPLIIWRYVSSFVKCFERAYEKTGSFTGAKYVKERKKKCSPFPQISISVVHKNWPGLCEVCSNVISFVCVCYPLHSVGNKEEMKESLSMSLKLIFMIGAIESIY